MQAVVHTFICVRYQCASVFYSSNNEYLQEFQDLAWVKLQYYILIGSETYLWARLSVRRLFGLSVIIS